MTRATPNPEIGEVLRALSSGRLDAAEQLCRDLIGRSPNDPAPLAAYSMILARSGRLDEAIESARRAAALGGGRDDLRAGLAQLLRSAGRIDDAIAEFEALTARTDDPEAWYGLAVCYEQTRRPSEASEAARRALAGRPGHPMAIATLARAQRATGDLDGAISLLDQALSGRAPTVALVHLHTERGKCLDALGRTDEAFSAFERANAAFDQMPETMRISRDAFPAMLERTRELVESEAWASRVRHEEQDRAPVFVVGFPRSGTTMLEQMLGAHSAVVTSDEAPFIRDVVRQVDQMGGHPARLAMLSEAEAASLRDLYWSRARGRLGDAADTRLLVDKQPLNIAYLACIGRVFPGARVIAVIRDPMDAVLSCYMQAFTPNQATVHLSSLRRAAELYSKVMDLWLETRDRTDIEWLMVRYEDLTERPREELERCLDHIGLAWEPALESFHERIGHRYISTPSYQSVGKPISRKSVGRWDRYHDRVAGVLPLVERFRVEFGYAGARD